MRRLFVGTKNRDKLREIEEILVALPLDLCALPKDTETVLETGDSLDENASQKALGYANAVGAPVLADDTGLFVDALGGAPGIHAANYAGPQATYAQNRRKLVEALKGVPEAQRTAHFRCVIALARPGTLLGTFEGSVSGRILESGRGAGDFGYDPLFLVPELGRTLAEIPAADKNKVSHRARALERARPALLELL